MTVTCPKGHRSITTDFCHECGRRIDGGRDEPWELVAFADRAYYDHLQPEGVDFPPQYSPRQFFVDQPEVAIGRRSARSGLYPDIDLAGAPEDPGISHRHAFLIRQPDGIYAIVDPGAKNGTTLNDDPRPIDVNMPVPLHDGDRIHLGAWTTIVALSFSGRRGVTPVPDDSLLVGGEADSRAGDLRLSSPTVRIVGAPPGTPTAEDSAGQFGGGLGGRDESLSTPTPRIVWLLSAGIDTTDSAGRARPDPTTADRFEQLIANVCDRYDGALLSPPGDAEVLGFPSATLAVAAALDVVGGESDSDGEHAALPVRIGLHVEPAYGRDPSAGPVTRQTVIAIQLAARPGQVLVSEAAAQAGLVNALPSGASLVDLGRHRLSDLSAPHHLHQLIHDTIASEVPPPRSLNDRPNNLPVHTTTFIGRGEELAKVASTINDNRLTTLTGPGGVGKTRLALQVAARLADAFPDGVWIADLSNVSNPDLVDAAVATAVGVREGGAGTFARPERPDTTPMVERLLDWLAETKSLVVINDCEQVAAACAELVASMLDGCPAIRILITSREPLALPGEAVHRLGPMHLPAAWEPTTIARQSEAVRLFANRALQQDPSLVLDEDAIELIVTICERVDGVPLAIELAAACTSVLPLPELASRLEHQLDLGTARDDVHGRQRTIAAMIEWSHNRLSDRERVLFRRMAAFRGAFTVDATREVCSGSGLERFEIVDLLSSLVNKSLVETDHDVDGHRYRLLEMTRKFASEQLERAGEKMTVQRAHVSWYQQLAERAEPELQRADQRRWLDVIEHDLENFQAALSFARAQGDRDDLRLAAALGHFWLVRGRLSEGGDWLDDALARYEEPADPLRLKGLTARAMIACFAGELDRATTCVSEALILARRWDSNAFLARALTIAGLTAASQGRADEAENMQREAIAAYEQAADPWITGFALTNLGNVLVQKGDTTEAKALYERSLAVRRQQGDEWGLVWASFRLGTLLCSQGLFPEGIALLQESLLHARQVSYGQGELLALVGLGDGFFANADLSPARHHYAEALDNARDLNELTGACLALAGLANVALAENDLPGAACWLTEAETAHAEMTLAAAIAIGHSRSWLARARGDESSAQMLSREGVSLARQLGDCHALFEQIEDLALEAAGLGENSRAAVLASAAIAHRDRCGLPCPPIRRPELDALVARIAMANDDGPQHAWALGLELALDDVVAISLDERPVFLGDVVSGSGETQRVDIEAVGVNDDDRWTRALELALRTKVGHDRAQQLAKRYRNAFPTSYRTAFSADAAADHVQAANDQGKTMVVRLERPSAELETFLRLVVMSFTPLALADVLPVLDHMGARVLDEHPHQISPTGDVPWWVYEFSVTCTDAPARPIESSTFAHFEEALAAVWQRTADDDTLNRTVLGASLPWRDVAILRVYSHYLHQIGNAFSRAYVDDTLSNHPGIARMLVELFRARFDPDLEGRDDACDQIINDLNDAIDRVASLDDDRILRSVVATILSTVRTNFFQLIDGAPPAAISIKLDGAHVPDLPLPRPWTEIFVYAPRFEGAHLRGGRVARGGIRWSERLDDYRTEILGLMKAQMVKNVVIVPVGAKGGFVVNELPMDPASRGAEIEACYRSFVGSLLDLTDNLVHDEVVGPPRVIRYDDDDPYLVVAADKGTATFSDIANSLSVQRGFWLGDAFASGGSTGYDHKAIGITSRGAWESAKRHFSQLGVDPERETITAVGIGDMSGDVFGNGLLRSSTVRLVGAFDHRHVLLDPDPDPARSFEERKRLFALPASSWADYDHELISTGGGVFERQAKAIPLSIEAQQLLALPKQTATPAEVVGALLRAPVDLLWNGGVGTFVKASDEPTVEVGDKTNDSIRVDGDELGCRVAVEGGNLGLTQRARVEFSLCGGLINTDAIDNSGGVDCSDHEVNIKILLDSVVAAGDLTEPERDRLLQDMTDEVAALVLRDNHLQALALGRNAAESQRLATIHSRYIRYLEDRGRLDRALERLPTDKQLTERARNGSGLTRPELAVLLAQTKMQLFDALVDGDLPQDAYFGRELTLYFPPQLRSRFSKSMATHALRREIIANAVTNDLVNRQEITFLFRVEDETGATIPDIARAYTAVRDLLGMTELWNAIDSIEDGLSATTMLDLLTRANRRIEWLTRWLLWRRQPPLDVAKEIARYAEPLSEIGGLLVARLREVDGDLLDRMTAPLAEAGVPIDLANRVCADTMVLSVLDVVDLAVEANETIEAALSGYLELAGRLHLGWLSERIDIMPTDNQWLMRAQWDYRDSLFGALRAAASAALRSPQSADVLARVDAWMESNAAIVRGVDAIISDLRSSVDPDAAALGVALREISRLLVGGSR
jgi:NAD-specific glutamate dehydrogenase/predicted ATPase